MAQKKYAWSEIFSLNETLKADWEKDPKGLSLLFWALDKGAIESEEFKNWASKHYSLPKLKPKFLKQIEKPLAREYKHLLDLNIIPMRKNEGVLYVACTQPTDALPVKEKVQFLVASYNDLKEAVQDTKDNLDKPDEEEKEISRESIPPDGIKIPKNIKPSIDKLPDGFDMNLTNNLKLDKKLSESPQNLNIKKTSNKQSVDAPSGLAVSPKLQKTKMPNTPENLNMKVMKKTKSFAKDDVLDFPKKQTTPAIKLNTTSNTVENPKKTTIPSSPTPTPKALPEPKVSTNLKVESKKPKVPTALPIEAKSPKLNPEDIPKALKPSENKNPDIQPIKPKEIVGKGEESNVVPLKPKNTSLKDRKIDSFTGQNLPNSPTNNVHRIKPISPNNKTQNTKQNVDLDKLKPEFLEGILRSLDNKFDKKILFFIQDGNLVPVKWDESFVPKNTNPLNTLSEPSIFRIAFRSKDKYFGEVYKNEVNDLFFESWMNGQYPDRITVLSLLNNDENKVLGLFLGVHKLPDTTLDILDNVSKEIGHKLSERLS